MFERYTEKARRTIFFARYEASQFGSPFIETEHLLLGLLREDKALANRFLRSHAAIDSIRKEIEAAGTLGPKTSTSVDLPLSHECKRALVYGAEESERLNHKVIDPSHLLLGLLREEKSFAAKLLHDRGLRLSVVREDLARSGPPPSIAKQIDPPQALWKLLLAWHKCGGITVVSHPTVGGHNPDLAVFRGPGVATDGEPLWGGVEAAAPSNPAEEIALIRKRIKDILRGMEDAIGNHEFEKARFYSDEERKSREELRNLYEKYGIAKEPEDAKTTEPAPFLCLEFVRDESLSRLRIRIESYLQAGVQQVWLLDLTGRRAYTAKAPEGLQEFQGDVLKVDDPALELDLRQLFS